MDILIKILQFILCLSILVVFHEMGHYCIARLFKIRVERFYLFFNPGFSILRAKRCGEKGQEKWHFKWFSTKRPEEWNTIYADKMEYGIGWLPLGGYVKIAGMVDESMDKEQMAQPEQPWEFRAKPAWQRLPVMIAGVVFNLVQALIIYSVIMFVWGDQYIDSKNLAYGMEFSDVVKSAGLLDGDKIVSVDGKPLKLYDAGEDKTLAANSMASFLAAKQIVVERNGQLQTIAIPSDSSLMLRFLKAEVKQPPYSMKIIPIVDSIAPASQAEICGLMPNDSITAVDGMPATSLTVFKKMLADCKEDSVTLSFWRNGELMSLRAYIDSTATLGFIPKTGLAPSDWEPHKFGLLASIPAGLNLAKETLTGYIAQMKLVFTTTEGVKNLGGFASIGNMFAANWDWRAFWLMTAFLAVILAVMNILPIPLLDGGYVLFLIYEIISRRKPSDKFIEVANYIGLALVVALLLYANGNDIYRLFIK